jgi:hypothetical protein
LGRWGEGWEGTYVRLIPAMTTMKVETPSWITQMGMRKDLRYGACLRVFVVSAILIPI